MDINRAMEWAGRRKNGVLITIRSDGRPQSSDIVFAVDGDRFAISVTDSRAKTANLRRDPRAVLHLTAPEEWSYVSFDGQVELSPVAQRVDDETCDQLVRYYEAVAGGPHDDWAAYRQAMVDEGRLIAWFSPGKAVGQINT